MALLKRDQWGFTFLDWHWCGGYHLWCPLDSLFQCKVHYVCNKHDDSIQSGRSI